MAQDEKTTKVEKKDMEHPAQCPDCTYSRGWHYCTYHLQQHTRRMNQEAREVEES